MVVVSLCSLSTFNAIQIGKCIVKYSNRRVNLLSLSVATLAGWQGMVEEEEPEAETWLLKLLSHPLKTQHLAEIVFCISALAAATGAAFG